MSQDQMPVPQPAFAMSQPSIGQLQAANAAESQAIAQVQAAYIMAKRFPRDTNQAYARILTNCQRYSFAEKALYSYEKGASVRGPSIRMAEMIGLAWGNLDYGTRELERRKESSLAESYCLDLETNVRQSMMFEVPHRMKANGQMKILTDPRDIYELIANNGSRRRRACILGCVPGDVVEDAVRAVGETLRRGDGVMTLEQRVRRVVLLFKEIGVTQEQLEKRLKHPVDQMDIDEVVDLGSIYNALKDKQKKREDFFEFATAAGGAMAQEFTSKLKERGGHAPTDQLQQQQAAAQAFSDKRSAAPTVADFEMEES